MRGKRRFLAALGMTGAWCCALQKGQKSGEEIEEAVPGAGKRKRPGVATAQAERSGGKLDGVEGNVAGIAADLRCEFCAEPGGGSDAVASEAHGKIHAIEFSGVRHDVESEIERAAPDEFNFGVAQLRVNTDHAAARTEFAGQFDRKNFGGDDVRADGNDFFS